MKLLSLLPRSVLGGQDSSSRGARQTSCMQGVGRGSTGATLHLDQQLLDHIKEGGRAGEEGREGRGAGDGVQVKGGGDVKGNNEGQRKS